MGGESQKTQKGFCSLAMHWHDQSMLSSPFTQDYRWIKGFRGPRPMQNDTRMMIGFRCVWSDIKSLSPKATMQHVNDCWRCFSFQLCGGLLTRCHIFKICQTEKNQIIIFIDITLYGHSCSQGLNQQRGTVAYHFLVTSCFCCPFFFLRNLKSPIPCALKSLSLLLLLLSWYVSGEAMCFFRYRLIHKLQRVLRFRASQLDSTVPRWPSINLYCSTTVAMIPHWLPTG